jgi:hypothetical protein
VEVSGEHGNERSGSKEGGEILDYQSNYSLFRKISAS